MRHTIFALIALLTGCTGVDLQFDGNTPETQADAGAVYFGVDSIRPWSQVADTFQPRFGAESADKLLEKVLPVTSSSLDVARSSVAASLGADLQQTSTTKSNTTETVLDLLAGESDASTQTSTRTREVEPGTVPGTDVSSREMGDRLPTALEADVDPFILYSTTDALWKHIQGLNTALSGQIASGNEIAFLVRTQVSVMPFARKQPLDVYTSIFVDLVPSDKENSCEECVRLVPLLALDNYERSSSRRLAQAMLQLDASISALVGGTGLGLGSGTSRERLKELAGSDFNALISVGSVNERELALRFGARQSVVSGYEMIPQTFSVAFLVIVNKEAIERDSKAKLAFFESSVFKNALTGDLVSNSVPKNLIKKVEAAVQTRSIQADPDRKKLAEQLLEEIAKDDFDAATQTARDLNLHTLAQRLAAQNEALGFTAKYSFIPEWQPVLPPPQMASMLDQPNSGAIVEISGGRLLSEVDTLQAFLVGLPKGNSLEPASLNQAFETHKLAASANDVGIVIQAANETKIENFDGLYLYSRSIDVDSGGTVRLNFPSPSALSSAGTPPDQLDFYAVLLRRPFSTARRPVIAAQTLEQVLTSEVESLRDFRVYKVLRNSELSVKAKAVVAFTAVPAVSKIALLTQNANAGAAIGSVRIIVERGKSPENLVSGYIFTIQNAELVSATKVGGPIGPSISVDLGKNELKSLSDGAYQIQLANLASGGKFTVSVTPLARNGDPIKSATKPVEFEVR